MLKTHRKLLLLLCLLNLTLPPAWADVADHLKAAEGYMSAGQWDYANYEWRNALEQDPRNPAALLGLGRSLLNAGMISEAIQHLLWAKKVRPHLSIDMALADAIVAKGDYVTASKGYQYILKKEPNNADAFRKLKALQDKLPEQRREVSGLYLERRWQEALAEASEALKKDDYRKAVQYLELLSTNTADDRVLNNYALSLLLTGNSESATRMFYRLTRQNPEAWKFHTNSAMALLGVGKTFAARREIERAIGLCDDNKQRARLYNNLGYAYEAAGKPTYARFAYERAISLNPGLTKAYLNLGFIFQQLMEYDNAVKTYKTLLTQRPDNAEAWNQLGFAYEQMHESRQAVAAYNKAIAHNPRLEEAYFNLGTLYKKMDKMDKASEIYRKMVSLKFGAIEKGEKTAQNANLTRQARLIEYVYLYFDDLS